MAGPCLVDTSCIALSVDSSGKLQATPIISPDTGNELECRANGLFAISPGSALFQATTPASSAFTVTATAPAEQVVQTGQLTVTNPDPVRSARFLVIADLGSIDFFVIPPGNVVAGLVYRAVLPAVLALRHRFTVTQQVPFVNYRMEDATAPEFFAGTLGPGASATCQVQRRVNYQTAGSGGVQGIVGAINWIGLVVPA